MAYTLFRARRFVVIALAALLAAGCGATIDDQESPKTELSSVEAPSPERLAEVQLRVGRTAFDQGNLSTALDLFEKAHKTAPDSAPPLVGKGDVLFAQRRFEEAEIAYRAAVARDARSFEAQEGLGKTLVTLKNFEDGLKAFQAARAIRADAALFNKIGVTHELLGDGAAAQAAFRQALVLDPASLTARNNLALSLAVSSAYDEALTEMEQVVSSPESSDRHRANLAFIYGLAGRPLSEAPQPVMQAAAEKGWDEEFFARTREVAATGDRAAILDLLNSRTPREAQLPTMPEMPESSAEMQAPDAGTASSGATAAEMDASGTAEAMAPGEPQAAAMEPAMPAEPQDQQMAMRTPGKGQAPPAANAAKAPADEAASAGRPYRVQLGAYAKRWLGRALRQLGKAAGDGLLPENRVEVVRGPKYHTIRTVGIAGHDEARALCVTLRSRNVDCFVTRQKSPPPGHGFDITQAGDADALALFLAAVEPVAPAGNGEGPARPESTVAALDAGPTARGGEAAATTEGTHKYRIQFAAYRRAGHLDRGLKVLHKMAGDLLPAVESLVRAETAPETGIPYRLRSVPMESRAAADALCKSLTEKGVECLVIRHGDKTWQPLG